MELIQELWTPVERPPLIMQGKQDLCFYLILFFLLLLQDVFIDCIITSQQSPPDFIRWFVDFCLDLLFGIIAITILCFLEPEVTIFGWEGGAQKDLHCLTEKERSAQPKAPSFSIY